MASMFHVHSKGEIVAINPVNVCTVKPSKLVVGKVDDASEAHQSLICTADGNCTEALEPSSVVRTMQGKALADTRSGGYFYAKAPDATKSDAATPVQPLDMATGWEVLHKQYT